MKRLIIRTAIEYRVDPKKKAVNNKKIGSIRTKTVAEHTNKQNGESAKDSWNKKVHRFIEILVVLNLGFKIVHCHRSLAKCNA